LIRVFDREEDDEGWVGERQFIAFVVFLFCRLRVCLADWRLGIGLSRQSREY